jgi:hypothetical protein
MKIDLVEAINNEFLITSALILQPKYKELAAALVAAVQHNNINVARVILCAMEAYHGYDYSYYNWAPKVLVRVS